MAKPSRLQTSYAHCTVLRSRIFKGSKPPSRRRCLCLCECGQKFFTWAHQLQCGNTTSCGCRRATRLGKKAQRYSEGYSVQGHPLKHLYARWQGMVSRCTWPEHESYRNYGGRGIRVCERWYSFENFYADMGEPPFPGASIDRKDNNGNYEPSNCRWATAKEQAANRRKTRDSRSEPPL